MRHHWSRHGFRDVIIRPGCIYPRSYWGLGLYVGCSPSYYPYDPYYYPYYPYVGSTYVYPTTTVYTTPTVVTAPTTTYYDTSIVEPQDYEPAVAGAVNQPPEPQPEEIAPPPGDTRGYDAGAYLRDGDAAFTRSDYSRAADAYQRALALHGERAQAQLSMGLALIGLREYDAAADALRQALMMQPRLAASSFDLRRSFPRADLPARMSDLQSRAASNPNNADAQFLLGFANYFGGDVNAGRAAFERSASLAPNDKDLLPFLDEMRRTVSSAAPLAPVPPASVPMGPRA